MTPIQDHRSWSNSEVVNLCMTTPHFAGSSHGNRLTRISEALVVKFGIGVRREEAATQDYVYQHVDHITLYVPQVFRFFNDSSFGFNMGFIVMEYVSGTGLEALDVRSDPTISRRTIEAIRHLATVPKNPGQRPGPFGGGAAYGYLWSENGTGRTLDSIRDMEDWLNLRLAVVDQPRMNFPRQQQLSMCHMDLVKRNICVLADSRICFFDWAFAGFYPAIFEIFVFRELYCTDSLWFGQLLDLSPQPDAIEEDILRRLGLPAMINDKFSFDDAYTNRVTSTDVTPPPALPPFRPIA